MMLPNGQATKCVVCKCGVDFFLAAPELKGEPAVCSRCMFRKLTGKRYVWKGEK